MHLFLAIRNLPATHTNTHRISPDIQIQPKLFPLVKRTDIYISSHKLLLNRLISMEVRLSTFPLSCVNNEFSSYSLHRCAINHTFQLCDVRPYGGNSPWISTRSFTTLPRPGKNLECVESTGIGTGEGLKSYHTVKNSPN